MNKNKFTHLFFDLDGTLTDSGPGILNSVRYALRHFGIEEADADKLRLFIGPPLVDSFMELYGFSEEKARRAMAVYREYFSVTGIFENSVYDGILRNLELLKKSGKHLYVATGKPEIFMGRILEHYGLAEYFEFAGGSDIEETRSRKAQIIRYVIEQAHLESEAEAGNILMIGDRKHDVIGAVQNGIPCAGVLWGYGSEKELEDSGADFLLGSPDELSSLI